MFWIRASGRTLRWSRVKGFQSFHHVLTVCLMVCFDDKSLIGCVCANIFLIGCIDCSVVDFFSCFAKQMISKTKGRWEMLSIWALFLGLVISWEIPAVFQSKKLYYINPNVNWSCKCYCSCLILVGHIGCDMVGSKCGSEIIVFVDLWVI